MKTLKLTAATLLLSALLPAQSWSQAFNSGSDGSYGPMNINNTFGETLVTPSNGVFNCTTINMGGGYLGFTRNALNTPIYLLATGDVTIGYININVNEGAGGAGVRGAGGPGGFDGGNPGFADAAPGAGQGPGGGKGGTGNNEPAGAGGGAYATVGNGASTNKGTTYGSPLLFPIMGGSGGGGTAFDSGGSGGGGGGGAIVIASNTKIEFTYSTDAKIFANGGNGGGSGGAIRLIAPTIIFNSTPADSLQVQGGGSGGSGRVRIDTLNLVRVNPVNLALPSNSITIGSLMAVFPDPLPQLDILEAAGTSIPEGTPGPVNVVLPVGSSSSRTVTVQARNFGGMVPIKVVLTPESGGPVEYSTNIDNGAANPAQAIVNVTLPINTPTTIHAWRR